MKNKLYIVFIVFLVLLYTKIDLMAQATYTLCSGSKNVKYQVIQNPGSIYHWSVVGGQIISDPLGSTIIVNWDNNQSEYIVSVFEETATGCLGNNMEARILMKPSPAIDLGNNKNICEGEQIELNPGSGFSNYLWHDGSTGPVFVASSSGIYWVEVTNGDGCSYRDSVEIEMNSLPEVNLGLDTALCAPDELFLDAGEMWTSFIWNNGMTSQTRIAREGDGKIWVNVTDENGCVGTDTIQILNCIKQLKLDIPNAFTPNGDGRNDFWNLKGFENYPDISVKIYDRWGIQVFSSEHGYAQPWDGTSNGRQLPTDAYYYIINPGDGSKEITGSITLIR
jgi:gliding motility-associated-like protein